jgi:hypothetical protein
VSGSWWFADESDDESSVVVAACRGNHQAGGGSGGFCRLDFDLHLRKFIQEGAPRLCARKLRSRPCFLAWMPIPGPSVIPTPCPLGLPERLRGVMLMDLLPFWELQYFLKETKFILVPRYNVADLVETMGTLPRTVSGLKLFNCLFIRREDIELLSVRPRCGHTPAFTDVLCEASDFLRCSLPIHTV